MNQPYKILFLLTLMSGTMISISSPNWIGIWMGLEINLLSFIPLMKSNKNNMSSESCLKYFLIQAFSSSLFLIMSIVMMIKSNMMNEMLENSMETLISIPMLIKMGAAPFHAWFPEIIEGISWMNSMILMTWQKIAPMMILSYLNKSNTLIIFTIVMCSIIGSIGGLNQTSVRKMLVYSSINHISWMISSFLSNYLNWTIYFLSYSIILTSMILMFKSMKCFMIKQMFPMNWNIFKKLLISFNLMSMGGLPPFLGFLPKWIIIQSLSNEFQPLIIIMIMCSLITIFFYLRITISNLNMNMKFINKYKLNINNGNMIPLMSLVSSSSLILISLIFMYI